MIEIKGLFFFFHDTGLGGVTYKAKVVRQRIHGRLSSTTLLYLKIKHCLSIQDTN